ncbi:deleted in malignant brain tumors 1 protein-like [Lytechinus variegatus]|uniref:deleted in malignant brain tumors 1 protein-like n=1 Tax=Lytechinus variegatus TaxID=7654 RepID=UPI001BB1D793|nr:deleted in malignant brain tumors 1 protein-like [Lytechinus variegatus]
MVASRISRVHFWIFCAFLFNFAWISDGQSWYDVRLVGGSSANAGRVEIYYFGTWGTVCDDGFGYTEADIICQQLGYESANTYYTSAYFGEGSGNIWLDDVDCTGNEYELADCDHDGWGVHNCYHGEDVGVECYVSDYYYDDTDVRLSDGDVSSEGRVEILYNGQWGTICDDSWGREEADVVCQQLGYSRAIEAVGNAYFGQGSGQIWLDDVSCSGLEGSIDECSHDGWGTHNCHHSEDAGVRCYDGEDTGSYGFGIAVIAGIAVGSIIAPALLIGLVYAVCKSSSCTTPVDVAPTRHPTSAPTYNSYDNPGPHDVINRPPPSYDEINKPTAYANPHGVQHPPPPPPPDTFNPVGGHTHPAPVQSGSTYPNNAWQAPPAGAPPSSYPPPMAPSGTGDQYNPYADLPPLAQPAPVPQAYVPPPTHVPPPQQLYCFQEKLKVGQSMQKVLRALVYWFICNFIVRRDAAAISVRLSGSGSDTEGRVEVFYDGEWGTVCDDLWGDRETAVVCSQLGFRGESSYVGGAFYGQGTGRIWLDNVQCVGTESSLEDCIHLGWGIHNCGHYEDVGVICSEGTNRVRLTGGDVSSEGRVEISYNGQWGTICDDSWGQEEADVVCQQLGYSRAVEAVGNAHFGEGSGQIWLDDLSCSGLEDAIGDCHHGGWGSHDCVHSQDAGVVCYDGADSGTDTVRLIGGSSSSEGRVEIFYNGQWGTICDDSWGQEEANVVCHQLGYSRAIEAVGNAHFGQGSGQIWLDDLSCSGLEGDIEDCHHGGWGSHNCVHSEDAGVRCYNDGPNEGEVRLVGGSSSHEGRVEIYKYSEWGTICDDGWDIEDGITVCQQLGYSSAISVHPEAYFGSGSGVIWLHDVDCTGSEPRLDECTHSGWGGGDCTHEQDAGVRCTPGIAENSLRLTDGHGISSGRVEIYHGGEWGTVCDDGWDLPQARIVCRQLGFPGAVSSHSEAHFGEGTDQIWLDNVDCIGTESRLSGCRHNGWGSHNCHHGEDAGVTCQEAAEGNTKGAVALVNSQGRNWYGRVQIYYNNTWGTVCDTLWSLNEARVVCNSLGFDDVDKWKMSAEPTEGPIWLDNVHCDGTESSLVYCTHAGWGVHRCDHTQDVAISCYNYSHFKTGHIVGILGGTVFLVVLGQYIKAAYQKSRCCNHSSTSTTPVSAPPPSSNHHRVTRDDGPGFSGNYFSRPDTAPPSYDSIFKYSTYHPPPPPDPAVFSPEGGTRSPPPPYLPPSSTAAESLASGSTNYYPHSDSAPDRGLTPVNG